jgi:hypothetical protein
MAKDTESDAVKAALPRRIPHWRIFTDQGVVTPEIIDYTLMSSNGSPTTPAILWSLTRL